MRISASKIKTYEMCPLNYDWTYNKKLISIKGKALYLGSKYHELVRQYHIDWKEHRNNVWEEYDFLHSYIKNPMKWNIVDTEKRIMFTIPDTDIEVTIIIDRIDEDKLIDYKTSSFDYTEEECKNIQSLLYVYYFWITEWRIYPFVFHVINKKKCHQKKYLPQIMKPVIYTEEELAEVPTIIKNFIEKTETGVFKATPSPMCWGCGFWPNWLNYCKHYQKVLFKKK